MKIKKLISERLNLIPLGINQLSEEYVSWMNDNEVNFYLESGGDYDIIKLKEYLNNIEKSNIYSWAIYLKGSKHIGNIKIDPINLDTKVGEYGILIGDKNEWGKGYAKEASQIVINFCFNYLNLKKIELGVKMDNLSAINLYQKMGFVEYKADVSKNSIRMFLKND
jgi:[ribosomal protein S5]-alanine N-acetyltransferase